MQEIYAVVQVGIRYCGTVTESKRLEFTDPTDRATELRYIMELRLTA